VATNTGRRTCSPLATNTADNFYLFNDLSAHIVRTLVYQCYAPYRGVSGVLNP